jgi:MYXO-CTERM domain-containing protein
MNKAEQSAISVMPDYDGPFEPFALVLAVPGDVTLDHITTLRREFVDRVDQISAPRFHEFWETDPCDPSKATQEWERDLRVSTSSDNFLGGSSDIGPTKKVPKEMLLNVKSEQKQGEYTFMMPEQDQSFLDFAKGRGWLFTAPMEQAINQYQAKGLKFVLAEVDPNRIELIGGERAQMSPIRFWTSQPYRNIPARLSLLSANGPQELFVLVLDPEKRFVPKNYEVSSPPTNVTVDFVVKERMGEFFGGLHDIWLAKHPKTWWLEFAWSADGCGQPCPNEPLFINELLTLGADVFEQSVPDDEKNPKPPPLTDEEKASRKNDLDQAKPADRYKLKLLMDDDRKELFRRKALLERHHYVITRLHHRVSEETLPTDVDVGPVDGGLQGGVLIPTGPKGELSLEVKPSDAERMQTRYLFYHPWKGMQSCETPVRWRWGKPPRTYRGLRKTWVVEDLARKSRTQIKPSDVVRTPLPEFGLSGEPPKSLDGGLDGGLEGSDRRSGCHCSVPGQTRARNLSGIGLLAVFTGIGLRRRRQRR